MLGFPSVILYVECIAHFSYKTAESSKFWDRESKRGAKRETRIWFE